MTWTQDANSIATYSPTPTGDAGQHLNSNFATISTLITQANTLIAALQTAVASLTSTVAGKAAKASPSVAGNAANVDGSGNVVDSGITLASKANASTVSSHLAATQAHGTTGNIVGTSDTQTLTNKTISGASNTLTSIPESAVTNLTSDLAGKAPLASPSFTGDSSFDIGSSHAVTYQAGTQSRIVLNSYNPGIAISFESPGSNSPAAGAAIQISNHAVNRSFSLQLDGDENHLVLWSYDGSNWNKQTFFGNDGSLSLSGTLSLNSNVLTGVGSLNMAGNIDMGTAAIGNVGGLTFANCNTISSTSASTIALNSNTLAMGNGSGSGGGTLSMEQGQITGAGGITTQWFSSPGIALDCAAGTLNNVASITFSDATVQSTAYQGPSGLSGTLLVSGDAGNQSISNLSGIAVNGTITGGSGSTIQGFQSISAQTLSIDGALADGTYSVGSDGGSITITNGVITSIS